MGLAKDLIGCDIEVELSQFTPQPRSTDDASDVPTRNQFGELEQRSAAALQEPRAYLDIISISPSTEDPEDAS